MLYIDTSAIIAALDPSDHRREKALKILNSKEYKIISELGLVELANVLSRRREILIDLINRLGFKEEIVITTLLYYIMKRFNLKYEAIKTYQVISIFNNISKITKISLELLPRFKLKTLDLLHIAYIKALKNEGIPINTLATVDKDFAKVEDLLEKEVGVKVHLIE